MVSPTLHSPRAHSAVRAPATSRPGVGPELTLQRHRHEHKHRHGHHSFRSRNLRGNVLEPDFLPLPHQHDDAGPCHLSTSRAAFFVMTQWTAAALFARFLLQSAYNNSIMQAPGPAFREPRPSVRSTNRATGAVLASHGLVTSRSDASFSSPVARPRQSTPAPTWSHYTRWGHVISTESARQSTPRHLDDQKGQWTTLSPQPRALSPHL